LGLSPWSAPLRLIGSWHIPIVLLIAAVCLIAGVTLPVLIVREFFLYGQELSVIDGVHALFDAGGWLLATVLGLFSIIVPMVKILSCWCCGGDHEKRSGLEGG